MSALFSIACFVIAVQLPAKEISFDDYKELVETNIFSPPKAKKPAPTPSREKPKEERRDVPKGLDPVVVTGFMFVETQQRYEAVIEDKKKKDIRFAKAGDVVEGWAIISVAHDKMVASRDGGERAFKVGEAMVGVAPPPPLEEKALLGENEIDPKKFEEVRQRRREQLGKKTMVDDEEPDATAEKKKK